MQLKMSHPTPRKRQNLPYVSQSKQNLLPRYLISRLTIFIFKNQRRIQREILLVMQVIPQGQIKLDEISNFSRVVHKTAAFENNFSGFVWTRAVEITKEWIRQRKHDNRCRTGKYSIFQINDVPS